MSPFRNLNVKIFGETYNFFLINIQIFIFVFFILRDFKSWFRARSYFDQFNIFRIFWILQWIKFLNIRVIVMRLLIFNSLRINIIFILIFIFAIDTIILKLDIIIKALITILIFIIFFLYLRRLLNWKIYIFLFLFFIILMHFPILLLKLTKHTIRDMLIILIWILEIIHIDSALYLLCLVFIFLINILNY